MLLLPAIAPLSLARVARETNPTLAMIACALSLGLTGGSVAALLSDWIVETFPSRSATGYATDLFRAALGYCVFFMIITAAAQSLIWLNAKDAKVGPSTRALMLSPLTILLPTFIWAAAMTARGFREVAAIPRSHWIYFPVFDVAASCFWLPLIALAWAMFTRIAMSQLRATISLCRCGYDRRGLSGPCPECGAGSEAIE